jgi:hypothetical protein
MQSALDNKNERKSPLSFRDHLLDAGSTARSFSPIVVDARTAPQNGPRGIRRHSAHSESHPATEWLRALCFADFSQHSCDETEEIVQRVKARCPGRRHMLNPALESSSLNFGFRSKLDYEGRFVLPSFHRE